MHVRKNGCSLEEQKKSLSESLESGGFGERYLTGKKGKRLRTYNLLEGEQIISRRKTAKEISEMFDVHQTRVHIVAKRGEILAGRYRLELAANTSKDDIARMLSVWDGLVAPFHKVILCKNLTPGVKKLKVKPK